MSSSKQFEAKGGASLSRRTLSRRTLVGAQALTAATLAAGKAFAQATPPRSTAVDDHPAAARFQPPRRGDDLLHRPRRPVGRSEFRRDRAAQQRHPAAVDRRAVVGRPAWNAQGRYLVWSDIPNNRNCAGSRMTAVSVFRSPSNNSNGKHVRLPGRQLSCGTPHATVVRYELDGSVTVLADSYNGKRLNSPNDVVPHPDGSYWFTDPPYGASSMKARPTPPAGRAMPQRQAQSEAWPGGGRRSLQARAADECYRIVPAGASISWSPRTRCRIQRSLLLADYKRLYVVSTGKGPGDTGPGARATSIRLTSNGQQGLKPQAVQRLQGRWHQLWPDGVRCDVNGNLWASSNAAATSATTASRVDAGGKLIGRIRLPEVCATLLRRPKRNRLFHGGEPVALRRLCEHAGRDAG